MPKKAPLRNNSTAFNPEQPTTAHRAIRAKWKSDAEAIVNSKTKITICPTPPDPRRTATFSETP